MKFENILEEVDGFGWFQLLIVSLVCIPRMVLPCHFLLQNFIAAEPSHHCDLRSLEDRGVFGNLSRAQRLTVGIPVQDDGSPSSCQMFAEPQFHLLTNVSNATDLPTVQCQTGWEYDNSSFPSTLATEWDLVCDRKWMNKVTATIFFVGVMFGAVAFGTLCDKFGRRSMLLVSYTMSMGFGLISVFSNSYIMFAVMRFLTGFGLVGISIISTVLSIEWVDVEHRAFIGAICSMAWTFGNMMLAGIAYLVTDWRMLIAAVTAPLGFGIITWWWIPESARWLLANGKVDRARFYLEKCARLNKKGDVTPIKLESLSNVAGENQKTYSYLDLFRTPGMRRLTLLTGIVWYGVSSTYYGISLNITGFGLNIYLTHFIYSAIEMPAKIIIYFCLNAAGRRRCQAGTLLLTGTCVAVNIFLPKDMWHVRTVVAVLGKGLSEASFTTVFLYTTELYPTVLRQNGIGYTSFVARLGVAIAPLIIRLDEVWTPLPQVIICSVAILSGLVACLLPETLNARMPENIEDIENKTSRQTADVPLRLRT